VGDARAGGTSLEAQMPRTAAPDPGGPTAAQRYRTGLELMANRDFEKAIAELTQAIVIDPRLAVAYAARASAKFGVGRYRESADDYHASLAIDPNLGTPLYGLAECYRVLGEGKRAAEMYQRYADSKAPEVREDLRAIAAKRAQELR
jgi:tetratricopeptide (TPR) repeat protein